MTDEDVLKLIIDRITKYRDDETLAFEEIALSDNTINMLSEMISADESTIRDNTLEYLQILNEQISNNLVVKDDPEFSEFVKGLENDFRNQLKMIKRISKTGKEGTVADLYKQARKDAVKAKKASAKKNDIDIELLG